MEPVHHVENRAVPGPACDIPVRIYRPQPSGGQPLSALVYLHGGGFCLWGLDEYDGICRALANAVPCVVVSVDYRCFLHACFLMHVRCGANCTSLTDGECPKQAGPRAPLPSGCG